jgi:hypothetical protein
LFDRVPLFSVLLASSLTPIVPKLSTGGRDEARRSSVRKLGGGSSRRASSGKEECQIQNRKAGRKEGRKERKRREMQKKGR